MYANSSAHVIPFDPVALKMRNYEPLIISIISPISNVRLYPTAHKPSPLATELLKKFAIKFDTGTCNSKVSSGAWDQQACKALF
jgi:hypothetical protein